MHDIWKIREYYSIVVYRMVSIISIFFGFVLLMLAEWRYVRFSQKNQGKNKPEHHVPPLPGHTALQVPGYVLIVLGMCSALLHSEQNMKLPEYMRTVCLVLALTGGGFLVWTVFLEIPLGAKKSKVPRGHAYARGSYGKCRHPGFWCFLLFSISLAMWANNSLVLISFFIANVLNLLLILLQDQYTFPIQFVDYREYAEKVPFLVPHFRKQHR
jgi:protein-S-isoprenylcysteine O-methyltransferase Ste14